MLKSLNSSKTINPQMFKLILIIWLEMINLVLFFNRIYHCILGKLKMEINQVWEFISAVILDFKGSAKEIKNYLVIRLH